ncbi:MAG TPA: hypothetical protein VJ653_04490 [Acidimicrobiales bacterium]|nr:hypothetical protein [Acidimicrobiales bacterium]
MRLNLLAFAVALAGVVAGAALIGRTAVGVAVIFDSIVVGVAALLWDQPERPVRGDQQDLIRRRAS